MDPNYADVFYVDTRNAVTDHRTGGFGGGFPSPGIRPGGTGTRTVYVAPQSAPAAYGPPAPWQPGWQPQGAAANWLNRITTGGIIDMVAQLFAALMPLPAAPVATQQTATDVGNSILYQQALAQYAKRDEQVRTLGSLVAKLIG